MITYDKDGVTLIDGDGLKVSPWNGDAYSKLLDIRGAQLAADKENGAALDKYKNDLAKAQASVDVGRAEFGPPAPVKPLQVVVDDKWKVSHVPFAPSLPDLVIPKTFPSGPIAVPTVDKQAIMFNMVQAMFRKQFPEA